MARPAVLVFFVSNIMVTLWGFAESTADPARYSGDGSDKLESEINPPYKASMQQTQTIANANNKWPYQLQNPSIQESSPKITKWPSCYSCADCPKVNENTTTKLCPYTTDISKQTKCVTYVESSKYSKKTWYVRGCASEKGSCLEIKAEHEGGWQLVDVNYCEECEGDLCNKNVGHRLLTDLTLALFTLVFCSTLS